MSHLEFEKYIRSAQPATEASPEPGLEDARAAWVGPRYLLFEPSFRSYDELGYQVSFRHLAWPAFFLTWFWFLYRKMYSEAAVVLAIQMILAWFSLNFLPENYRWALNLLFSLALCLNGHWLYWRATDRRIEKALADHHGRVGRAIEELKLRGGVNRWVIYAWIISAAFLVSALWRLPPV